MATIYGFSLKGIKTFKGREGEGCQGDIYYDGKKVGWYSDNVRPMKHLDIASFSQPIIHLKILLF